MSPETMTSMQRVLTALGQREPDRVPFFLTCTMHGASELGVGTRAYFARPELVAGDRQGDTLDATAEQRGPDPVLQRLDAAAERRLGDMARLGRTREVGVLGQRREVLEPVQFHRPHSAGDAGCA